MLYYFILFCCYMLSSLNLCEQSQTQSSSIKEEVVKPLDLKEKRLNPAYETESNHFLNKDGKFDPTLDSGAKDKRIFLKVPEHLRGFEVPANIRQFLNDLYPNMCLYVKDKLYDLTNVDHNTVVVEIIGNFCCYLLSPCAKEWRGIQRPDMQRYQIYDPIKFSKIPYYRWLLNNLGFFIKSFKQNHFNELKMNMISLSGAPSFDSSQSDYGMNIASLHSESGKSTFINDNHIEMVLSDISNVIKSFIKESSNPEYVYMLDVFKSLYDGTKVNDIALDIKESNNIKLKILNESLSKFENDITKKESLNKCKCYLENYDFSILSPKVIKDNVKQIRSLIVRNFPNLQKDLMAA